MDTVLQKHFVHVNILLKPEYPQKRSTFPGTRHFESGHRAILPGWQSESNPDWPWIDTGKSVLVRLSTDLARCAPVISIRKHLRSRQPPSCVRRLLGFVMNTCP